MTTPPAHPSRPVEIIRKKDRTGFKCTPSLRVYKEVGEGSDFHFFNDTNFVASITFDRHDLVLDLVSKHFVARPIEVPAHAFSGPLRVNTELDRGHYEYTVLLVQAEVEAEGGSRPDIEIRR